MQGFLRLSAFLLLVSLTACSGNLSGISDPHPLLKYPANQLGRHLSINLSLVFDPESGSIVVMPNRAVDMHVDLLPYWDLFPEMIHLDVLAHDKDDHNLTVEVTLTNPVNIKLCDLRAIFPSNSDFLPVTIDGWTLRGGAPVDNPDPFFALGLNLTNRTFEKNDSDVRVLTFLYKPPLTAAKAISFILDASVGINTAEPYEFGSSNLTGRFFHVQLSDWQDDITTAFLDTHDCGHPYRLRLAPFGDDGEWGTSIPDIVDGDYSLILTAESSEPDGETSIAVEKIDLLWPPETSIVPLPGGHGIYSYTCVDPDNNLPPITGFEFIEKFTHDMDGDWLIIEYGQICNSGELHMHSRLPYYIDAVRSAAPSMQIHLNFDKVEFPPAELDPCQSEPEYFTSLFFENLLNSIRDDVLENPDFNSISGLHFDVEPLPSNYSLDDLFKIYTRYADFLAKLHLEPDLDGRVITHWEMYKVPHLVAGDHTYLSTVDAYFGSCYFSGYALVYTDGYDTAFYGLKKMIAGHLAIASEHGRPMYPSLATFSRWIDMNQDTLGSVTNCGDSISRMIDEYCFGAGPFNTINEFDIVRAIDVHGMQVEQVMLEAISGEPMFSSSGLAGYILGDGDPDTISNDFVLCRTAYSVARAHRIMGEFNSSLIPGVTTFRYENNSYWKAGAVARPLRRGDITGVSGQVRFGDGLDIQKHPELWGGITIELIDPVTAEILNHPSYRTSIDIVGVVDGTYIFPDLPRGIITIRAYADGWESDPVTVDVRRYFNYAQNVDLILNPI